MFRSCSFAQSPTGEQVPDFLRALRGFNPSAMKNCDSVLAAMNKRFVFNNLCGKAAGTAIFKTDLLPGSSTMCGDQNPSSPTNICRVFNALRRCGDASLIFEKSAKLLVLRHTPLAYLRGWVLGP